MKRIFPKKENICQYLYNEPWNNMVWTVQVHLYMDLFLFFFGSFSIVNTTVAYSHGCEFMDVEMQMWRNREYRLSKGDGQHPQPPECSWGNYSL